MKKVYLNNLGSFETGNLKEAKIVVSRGVNSFAGVVDSPKEEKKRGRVKQKSRGRVKK